MVGWYRHVTLAAGHGSPETPTCIYDDDDLQRNLTVPGLYGQAILDAHLTHVPGLSLQSCFAIHHNIAYHLPVQYLMSHGKLPKCSSGLELVFRKCNANAACLLA